MQGIGTATTALSRTSDSSDKRASCCLTDRRRLQPSRTVRRTPRRTSSSGTECQLLHTTVAIRPRDQLSVCRIQRVTISAAGQACCVFRKSVTGVFGIVTDGFGNVTGHFGDVTDGLSTVS